MQNKLFTLLCTGLLAFALTSCDKNEDNDAPSSKLATPVLNITEQLSDGFTVSWQAVEHAAGYSYVFGNEAEKSTNVTSVSFSGLEPGTYTVKVKATAGSAEWSDSDYASISATIEEGDPTTDEMTFTFDISDITASSAVITCTPSVNDKTYFFDCMEKSLYDQMHTSDEAFSAALLESLETMGAEYGMTLEQVLSQLLSTGVDVWDPNGLKSSTEHVAYAFGLNTDGTVTTAIATKSFTTKEAAGGSDTGSWLGEWDATSTGSLRWYTEGQSLNVAYEENRPMDLHFTIREEQGLTVLYGWSQVDSSLPALCEINANGDLEVYAGVAVGSESQGYTPTWSAYCSIDSDFGLITGTYPAYTFSMNGDRATSTRYEGSLSGGESIRVVSLEIYALSDNQYAIYGQDFPTYYVAGDITMTKAAGLNSTKLAMALRKAQKSVAPGRLLPSSYVLTNMRAMN